ncbi:MAG: hypothetical protein R6W99_03520 [Clostridia bacterium]
MVHATADWVPFNDISGWTGAVVNRDMDGVRIYEATIWDDGLSVHLYALPNDYNQLYGDMQGYSTTQKVAYREQYCIMKFTGMPSDISARGSFLVDAFTEFAALLAERHPNATHNLVFTGHGGLVQGGEFFGLNMNYEQAGTFLGNWKSLLGRKLGFIDFGGPCMKGSFHALEAFSPYVDYYIASDLASGCTTWDVWDDSAWEEYYQVEILYNYHNILSSHGSMRDALIARVDLSRLRYEYNRSHVIRDKIMQSTYLYSTSVFAQHRDEIAAFMGTHGDPNAMLDVLATMKANGASQALIDAYNSIIIHGVDTKDFFTWPEDWNGMLWWGEF